MVLYDVVWCTRLTGDSSYLLNEKVIRMIAVLSLFLQLDDNLADKRVRVACLLLCVGSTLSDATWLTALDFRFFITEFHVYLE